jgi:hypothetical protein
MKTSRDEYQDLALSLKINLLWKQIPPPTHHTPNHLRKYLHNIKNWFHVPLVLRHKSFLGASRNKEKLSAAAAAAPILLTPVGHESVINFAKIVPQTRSECEASNFATAAHSF